MYTPFWVIDCVRLRRTRRLRQPFQASDACVEVDGCDGLFQAFGRLRRLRQTALRQAFFATLDDWASDDDNKPTRREISAPTRRGARVLWHFLLTYKEGFKDVRINGKKRSQQTVFEYLELNQSTGQHILQGRLCDENNPPVSNTNDPGSRRATHDKRSAHISQRGTARTLEASTVSQAIRFLRNEETIYDSRHLTWDQVLDGVSSTTVSASTIRRHLQQQGYRRRRAQIKHGLLCKSIRTVGTTR